MNESKLRLIFSELIKQIDPNPNRSGLKETPRRVVSAFKELTEYHRNKETINKYLVLFPTNGNNQLVTISNIFFASLCEHHLLPYYGYVSIGYIPNNKILGLSKFKRIVDLITKQLSVQEDLCQQIYDFFIEKLQPKALVVYIEGKHTCALVRGAKDEHSTFSVISKSKYFSKNPVEIDLFFKIIDKNKK